MATWIAALLFVALPLYGVFSQAADGPEYRESLRYKGEFDQLKGEPTSQKYGQVESVKVLWDLKKDKVYFISSQHHRWHYDFAKRALGYWQSRYVFNARNYADVKNREFCLANLNYYKSMDRWMLEFSTADEIAVHHINEFIHRIGDRTFIGDKLALFMNTERLRDLYTQPDAGTDFPLVSADEVYAGQTYQPLNCREAFGYLRRITLEDLESTYPGIKDIVVLNGSPLDMPVTAGVITTEFQTPLSHLNVLCHNRGTPIMAHKEIWTDPQLEALEGKLVYFKVLPDSWQLREAQIGEAERFWNKNKPAKRIKLKTNTSQRELMSMRKLSARSTNVVGGKAANFSVLARLANRSGGKWAVPEGAFAIPFHFYLQHFEASGADSLVRAILRNPRMRSDPVALAPALEAVRAAIKAHPVTPQLLTDVEARIRRDSPSLRMRFRSSTNAEDIEGFNGAGLYTSKTGIVGDTVRTIEKAIRAVWASVWNFRAFQEREYFGIDQYNVAMGILVHRSFPNENANGVAITKNLYRKSYFGFVINVQAGETSVVSPPPAVTCDQLICYSDSDLDFFKNKAIVEYISYSSETEGKKVLTDAQVIQLTEQLAKIKKHYYWNIGGSARNQEFKDFALDVEFKFDGPENQLYIKQVRPYRD